MNSAAPTANLARVSTSSRRWFRRSGPGGCPGRGTGRADGRLYVPMLLLQVVTTGLAEEPGWRDFALPRMQPRFGPVRGTVILGFLWGLWHLPLFLTEWGGWPDVRPADVIAFVFGAVAFSIVMTWVFNRTGQSLPVAIVLHAGVNTFFSLAWTPVFGDDGGGHSTGAVLLVASAMVATVLLVATRGRLGYEPAARGGPPASRAGAVADLTIT